MGKEMSLIAFDKALKKLEKKYKIYAPVMLAGMNTFLKQN